MAVTIKLAMDRMKRAQREEFFLKLLALAGPPPKWDEEGYGEWCITIEEGAAVLFPHWSQVDQFDATIQFRHWCNKRGAKQTRAARLAKLYSKLFNTGRRIL